jgi:hypothetical protein
VSDKGDAPTAVEVSVTPEFFSTMGTPLLRGRMFQESDDSMSQPVALVDEAAVRLLWGGADPVGRRVRNSRDRIVNGKPQPAPWMTVVGVVGNAKLSASMKSRCLTSTRACTSVQEGNLACLFEQWRQGGVDA